MSCVVLVISLPLLLARKLDGFNSEQTQMKSGRAILPQRSRRTQRTTLTHYSRAVFRFSSAVLCDLCDLCGKFSVAVAVAAFLISSTPTSTHDPPWAASLRSSPRLQESHPAGACNTTTALHADRSPGR